MRPSSTLLGFFLLALSAGPARSANVEQPLGHGEIELSPASLQFRARWKGLMAPFGAPIETATLRVKGGKGEGDSGIIELRRGRWQARHGGRLLVYTDASRSDGIRKVVVRAGKRGGQVTITGGRPGWLYAILRPHTEVTVTLTIGTSRFCAPFEGRQIKNRARRVRGISKRVPATCPCSGAPSTTWDAIQQTIFAGHGCTQAVCHGSSPGQGGLDLRPEAAFASLVDVASTVLPSQKRVEPGAPQQSLLWRKLAARTVGLAGVPSGGMPSGDTAALSGDELHAIELWIRSGAAQTGTVPLTADLLDPCLPPATPAKIRPPAPPAAGEGVQLYSPPWSIPAHGEDEVCFALWYDFSSQIPADLQRPCPPEWGGPAKRCFPWNHAVFTQDPNSHHSIPRIYRGAYDITDPGFGTYTCHGGALDGQPCDPKGIGTPAPAGADCGARSGCAGTVMPSVACVNYGPPDFSQGLRSLADSDTAPYIAISTQPLTVIQYPPGVSDVAPLQGLLVVNSHAFNLTDEPTTNEQWINLYFSGPDDRRYLVQDLFDADSIFIQNVPPFEEREYCSTHVFDQGTVLSHITSHTHKRGRLFRVWGPPIAPACNSAIETCLPEPGEPILTTTNYADPAQVFFDPPLTFDGADPASRTFKFCAIYDNGFTDPGSVKRRSTAPLRSAQCPDSDIRCLEGPHRGQACGGSDRNCDSSPGAGDGRCDACPLRGGVTTDDEMFILLGDFYCPEASSCYRPLP